MLPVYGMEKVRMLTASLKDSKSGIIAILGGNLNQLKSLSYNLLIDPLT